MALCSYDEAYTIPSKKAALISLRTMQILIEEMGLADTVDPLAGSYYVESLTNELEERMIKTMKEVEDSGGIVKAISEGYIQSEVSKQAYAHEKRIQSGEEIKVGVNKYRIEEEERNIEFHEYDPAQAEEQMKRLNKVKEERDSEAVQKNLDKLKEAANTDSNLMPYIIEAVKSYATVGEISNVFREVFGEFKEPVKF
jgi:methylmalonyl-CoA mutase N-terminal domain/subunit